MEIIENHFSDKILVLATYTVNGEEFMAIAINKDDSFGNFFIT